MASETWNTQARSHFLNTHPWLLKLPTQLRKSPFGQYLITMQVVCKAVNYFLQRYHVGVSKLSRAPACAWKSATLVGPARDRRTSTAYF